jgi:snapalysin
MVTGGHPVSTSYPFLARVGGCTGSLVGAEWIVTAKHCTIPATVRVGSMDRTSGGTVVNVLSTVSHPTSDIKLLHLAHSVKYAPVPIADTAGAPGTKTRIVGWGVTCRTRRCAAAPVIAHELDTSIRPDRECPGLNAPTEICTDNPHGNTGACYGDSGGPQLRRSGGDWVLVGATSRSGSGSAICAVSPSIYTDLTALRSWISARTGPDRADVAEVLADQVSDGIAVATLQE